MSIDLLMDERAIDSLRALSTPEKAQESVDAAALKTRQKGRVLTIPVHGALSRVPSFWQRLFGEANTYQALVEAVESAETDSSIDSVDLDFNTPGGTVDGLFQAVDRLKLCKKPRRAIVSGLCASAGYALACTCDEIIATCKADEIGSIGVVTQMYNREGSYVITSSDAPNKAPDPATDEGMKTIIERLNGKHNLFADIVVEGRKVSRAHVNEKFGKGGVLLAEEALACGMIDKLSKAEEHNMDFAEVKNKFSAEIAALETAAKLAEKERVLAHLEQAKESGGWEIALEAISKGEFFGASHGKAHGSFAFEASLKKNRASENVEPLAGTTSSVTIPTSEEVADEPSANKALNDQVLKILEGEEV
jgi:ClpP class serine protease